MVYCNYPIEYIDSLDPLLFDSEWYHFLLNFTLEGKSRWESLFTLIEVIAPLFLNIRSEDEKLNFKILNNRLIIRHDDLVLRHISVLKNGISRNYLVRIISKSSRAKVYRRISIDQHADPLDGVEKLYNEIEIREQLKHPNILSLYAVRETDLFVILCTTLPSNWW